MGIRDSLQKLKGYLTSPSSDYIAATGQFLELDGHAMARNLKLEKEGKSRGKACQPAPTATSLDSVEQNITSTVSADVARNQEILQGHLNSFGARVSQLQLDRVPEMKNEVLTVIGDFNNLISEGLDNLRVERRGVVDLDDEFKRFKSENNLFRTAVYPTAKVWHWGIILAMILLESVMNGFMLGQGAERGLVGGVAIAIAIAFLNVLLIGSFLGKTFRQAHHVKFFQKFFAGYLPSFLLLLVAVILNLTVAHFRDALGDPNVVDPGRFALDRLYSGDRPADAESLFLFLLGIGFCLLAAIDFLKMDDRYPLYGELDRRRDAKEKDYANFKSDELAELAEVRDETTEAMTGLREDVLRKKGEYLAIVDHRILVFEQFDRSVEHNQNVANQLLSIYRDANILARPEDCSVPRYFSEYQKVSKINVEARDHSEHNVNKLNDDANAVREALMDGIDRVHGGFKNAQETYRRIDQLTKEELELEIRQNATDSQTP